MIRSIAYPIVKPFIDAYLAANQAALKGPKGDTGDSAYQAWLAAGNSGSQAVFLASIKGAKGDTGQRGSVWTSASGAPVAAGLEGDQYLDTATGDVWQFS